MEAVFHKVKLKNGSYSVTVRHSQMRHLVQRRASDQHLCRLPGKLPRADAITEDRLDAKHLGFGKTPAMVAHFLLPRFAPNLPDAPQILIADQPLFFAVAMLPNLRIPLRRYRGLGFSFPERFITTALVIRAVAADLLQFILDLLQHLV